MGAFVGNVTSPFLRRRKGRIGKDIMVTKVAPTYAGGGVIHGDGNYMGMVCSRSGFDNTYQYSLDQASSAWQIGTLPAGVNRIGNSAVASASAIKFRPFNERMDLAEWALQCHFSCSGIHTGVGGANYRINPDMKGNVETWTVPGFPCECIAWSDNGQCFVSLGARDAGGNVQGRGGPSYAAPESFTVNVGLGSSGIYSAAPLDLQNAGGQFGGPWYRFILGLSNGQPIKRLLRASSADWRLSGDIANPVAGSFLGHWIQVREMVIGFDANNPNAARSVDSSVSFSAVAIGGFGPVNGAFRWGNRIYAICRDAPRIRMSRNFGITWATSPVQPPDAGVQLTCVIKQWDQIFLIGSDGAVNRCYMYHPYNDI